MPLVARRSFTPQGMPWRGPRYLPDAISLSARAACSSARDSVRVTTQFNRGPNFLRRSRYILVRATEVILRDLRSLDSSPAEAKATDSGEPLYFAVACDASRNTDLLLR